LADTVLQVLDGANNPAAMASKVLFSSFQTILVAAHVSAPSASANANPRRWPRVTILQILHIDLAEGLFFFVFH
jgi:hypothetical protein